MRAPTRHLEFSPIAPVARVDPRRAALCLLMIDSFLAGAFFVLRALGHSAEMLDIGAERSIPTWYSTTKLFVLAQVLGLIAWLTWRRSRRHGSLFLLLGLVALVLSIDEIVQLHERYGLFVEPLLLGRTRDELLFHRSGYWMVALGPPLALALAVLLWMMARHVRMPRAVALRGLAGVALFLVSATVIEALGNFAEGYAARTIQVTVEEAGEMMGITLVLWAALDLLLQTARAGAWGLARHGP
jgi:hypothetical protein